MAGRTCHNCVFARVDSEQWLRCRAAGEAMLVRCANHPYWPGELHEVPGTACANYKPRTPEPKGKVKRIPLSRGQYALVDTSDYEWLSQYTWQMCASGYALRIEKGKRVYMHRQIMDPPKGMIVDHIDCNQANNCRANLRLCTPGQNGRNRSKQVRTSSRFKGVSWHKKSAKWRAGIRFKGEQIWLGYFVDEVEAAQAYDAKAVELFGEFARLNFPGEWPAERRAAALMKDD
ncbi:MAG: HNH endonuclease [Sedimentisphaerales bacterium]|nr:HNH endonuclease [Sedimentisphaerales bacterium]